ncbi:MAG: hypothetical protein ACJAV6_000236 [Candidatus Paceibacteria bacterium]|jgi:hypothetical protein
MEQKDTIVNDFLQKFPEIKKHPLVDGDDYSDTPYIFFGVVYEILLKAHKDDVSSAEKIIIWVNDILNSIETDKYIKDMLWIELFEGSELNNSYRDFLLSHFSNDAHLMYRQYLYIMEHGGLTDPETGEILKFVKMGNKGKKTGKYISDIK